MESEGRESIQGAVEASRTMKRQVRWTEKVKLFFELHWLKVIGVAALLVSIVWPITTLMSLDSYQRTYMYTLLSMAPLQSIIYIIPFAIAIWWIHYGGLSFSKLAKSRVKDGDINVKWDEVIGMEEAKQEAWEVVELLRDMRHGRLVYQNPEVKIYEVAI